jgi:hypothetical protein
MHDSLYLDQVPYTDCPKLRRRFLSAIECVTVTARKTEEYQHCVAEYGAIRAGTRFGSINFKLFFALFLDGE